MSLSKKQKMYVCQRRIWREKKRKFIEIKGGKCQNCGYNKCIAALEFHHLDPNKKEFSPHRLKGQTLETALVELEKCVLLCANCHREEHYLKEEIKNIQEDLDYRNSQKEKILKSKSPKSKCPICNKDNYKNTKCCSVICANISRRKVVNRPSKEVLLEELKTNNYTQVAKKYGVRENSIKKWLGLRK